MGKDRDYFTEWFKDDPLSTLRATHIQPRSKNIVDSSELNENDVKLCCTEHTDAGFVTLVSTLGYPGLQIEIDNEWKSVKPIKDQIIVNLGDLLSDITNGKLHAARHRVVDIGIMRFSAVFGLLPKY